MCKSQGILPPTFPLCLTTAAEIGTGVEEEG